MASKDNSPAISFFSFQDIITSVTGIMFLVVIMLVVMVLQQKPTASARKSRELQEDVAALETEIKQLQDALAVLQRQAAEQRKRIEELKKLRAETLPELKKEWIRRLQTIDRSIAQIEEDELQISRRKKEQIELEKKAEDAIVANNSRIDELKKDLIALENEIKQKEQIFLKFKNVIRFVWNKSTTKKPVLLECSETAIKLESLDGSIRRRTFTDYNQCFAFCRTLSKADTYFVLLLKPSAFAYAEKFSRELQKAGFERGREILPDEQIIITGEAQQ